MDISTMATICEFCDLAVPISSLFEHVSACCARTDVCEVCSCYVRLRDMAAHRSSNCAFGATGSAAGHAEDYAHSSAGTPLLQQEPRHRFEQYTQRTASIMRNDEVTRWGPVVVAVGAVAAAAVFSTVRRRR
jgi:hypothetical protein